MPETETTNEQLLERLNKMEIRQKAFDDRAMVVTTILVLVGLVLLLNRVIKKID